MEAIDHKTNRTANYSLKQHRETMTEGKIEIPPPIGLLDTDSYSAKANRVTTAASTSSGAAGAFLFLIIAQRCSAADAVRRVPIAAAIASHFVAFLFLDSPVTQAFLLASRPVARLALLLA